MYFHCCSVDIDECAEGTASCSHGCKNTIGSYQCFCPEGTIALGDDQRTCTGEYMHVFSVVVGMLTHCIQCTCAYMNIEVCYLHVLN